jgi:hypothetical protein
MSWFRTHVYIATWLGLVMAVIAFAVKHGPKKFADVNWSRAILQFAALVMLGMSFVPWLPPEDKTFAHVWLGGLIGALIVDAARHRPPQ